MWCARASGVLVRQRVARASPLDPSPPCSDRQRSEAAVTAPWRGKVAARSVTAPWRGKVSARSVA
jgi:hypothetical protein